MYWDERDKVKIAETKTKIIEHQCPLMGGEFELRRKNG
jgi:hypothetical protein